jgi:formate-dependent nitrite reductase membrane component NrfD
MSREAADEARPADSYYGRPIINPPVWEEREIAGYLFCGGLAGASSILAAAADASARPRLANRARLGASAAVTVSFAALIKDLGRPERFVNMLRVFKPTSPMSVGTWILSAYAPLNYLASATTIARRAPLIGRAAGVGAGLLGSTVATYTSALIADTAVPAWHEGYRELPFLFAASAAAAAGGFGLMTAPVLENVPAARMALIGSAGELIAERLLERRLGPIAETLHSGVAGRRMRAAKVLMAAGLVGSATGARRSSVGAALTGAALVTGSALTRFGVFAAGMESARDPRYTVQLQRARAEAKVTLDVYPAAERAAETQ